MRRSGTDLSTWAADATDYKALIAAAADANEKLEHAQKLATRRLATGVMPELNACFAALNLGAVAPTPVRAGQRKAA